MEKKRTYNIISDYLSFNLFNTWHKQNQDKDKVQIMLVEEEEEEEEMEST